MTHTLQPLDVGVNAELKRRARENNWVQDKAEGKENADTLARAAQRLNEACHELPTSTITSALKKALPSISMPTVQCRFVSHCHFSSGWSVPDRSLAAHALGVAQPPHQVITTRMGAARVLIMATASPLLSR